MVRQDRQRCYPGVQAIEEFEKKLRFFFLSVYNFSLVQHPYNIQIHNKSKQFAKKALVQFNEPHYSYRAQKYIRVGDGLRWRFPSDFYFSPICICTILYHRCCCTERQKGGGNRKISMAAQTHVFAIHKPYQSMYILFFTRCR